MKYKVICDRPQTSRWDDGDVWILKSFKTEAEAGTYIAKIRKVHKEMLEAGYPWPGGKFDQFQTQPNDKFFIALGRVPFRKFYR